MDLVLLCLCAPALVLLTTSIVSGAAWLVRRRQDDRSPCTDHVRMLLPTGSSDLFELCCTCDAGEVIDGRWQFAPPVEADHTLG